MIKFAKTNLFDGSAKILVGLGTVEVVWGDLDGAAARRLRSGLGRCTVGRCQRKQQDRKACDFHTHGCFSIVTIWLARCRAAPRSCRTVLASARRSGREPLIVRRDLSEPS